MGYMDKRDKYLYSSSANEAMAYWDLQHKYMYAPNGAVFGYIGARGQCLYSLSGETVGYFRPPYDCNS
jgi:hypothetical protein